MKILKWLGIRFCFVVIFVLALYIVTELAFSFFNSLFGRDYRQILEANGKLKDVVGFLLMFAAWAIARIGTRGVTGMWIWPRSL